MKLEIGNTGLEERLPIKLSQNEIDELVNDSKKIKSVISI